MKLILATRNTDKIREIQAVFDLPGLEILGAGDVPGMPEVEEDGDTLEANAIKKAVACALFSGSWALADDTGLEVEALGGAPGVYSSRYAGENATYDSNCEKLIREMRGQADRTARFRTIIALASPQGETRTVAGTCEGVLAEQKRGMDGFGYDPLFIPEGFDLTFAELSLDEKNRISHRGRALAKARRVWAPLLASRPEAWPDPA